MSRPGLLLVGEFTELTWTSKPQVAEWAEEISDRLAMEPAAPPESARRPPRR